MLPCMSVAYNIPTLDGHGSSSYPIYNIWIWNANVWMFERMNEQNVIQFLNLMVIYTSLAFTHHTHTQFRIPVSKFTLFCKAKPLNPYNKFRFSIGFWLIGFSESLTSERFAQHTFQFDCTLYIEYWVLSIVNFAFGDYFISNLIEFRENELTNI